MTSQPPRPAGNDPARIPDLLTRARMAWRLVRDPRVPWTLKLIPALALLYVVSPVDLAPDFIPLLGQIDDVAILLVALKLFVDLASPGAPAGSGDGGTAADPEAQTISTTYRVKDDGV